jgi:dihydroorotase
VGNIKILNARIIDTQGELDRVGDILIVDGILAEIKEKIKSDADFVIDACGLVAAPGLVDMHVHTRDPGYTHKADITDVCECAAAGGFTSVAAMPNTKPAADNINIINYVLSASKQAKINVYPVGAITKNMKGEEITDLPELKNAGAIAFSDDGEPVMNSKILSEAMKCSTWLDTVILAHCEDKYLSGQGIINEGIISRMLGVEGIPASSESAGIALVTALAKATNARVHICHVSTADGVDFIRFAKRSGIRITAETCPHYFSLNEEQLVHQDADYRMNPPLRTEDDKRAIIRAIIDGTIDVIATDHAPHTPEEKKDFYSAPNGVIGLETALAAGITNLVKHGYISLFKLIYMMSTVPAQILGIHAGGLKIGEPANIVIFDPDEKWIVTPELLHSKAKNTAFKGMELSGKIKFTFSNGKLVYKN